MQYFAVHTSVVIWVGVNDLNQNLFWAGWGRRKLNGIGMRLEEQIEDATGVTLHRRYYWCIIRSLFCFGFSVRSRCSGIAHHGGDIEIASLREYLGSLGRR